MTHHAGHSAPNADMQRCIEACLETHARCIETAAHCLEMGGQHASRKQQVRLLDCADVSLAAANLMLRGSELHHAMCGVCAEACHTCAKTCRDISGCDEVMIRCAEACERSAARCERMAAAVA